MLRFRLFGMPVVVQGSFLLIAALVGLSFVGGVADAVAWVAIVFVSILIHELGHAFTARRYGKVLAIELNGLGGLTRWTAGEGLAPGRRALIAAAGSAFGLVFGGVVWLVASAFDPYPPMIGNILESIIYVNVFWGLLNWLPIRPLDGGHLLESLLDKVAPTRSKAIGRVVFSVTAAAALLLALRLRMTFIAILAGWMLVNEITSGRGRDEVTPGLPELRYDDETVGTVDGDPEPEEPEEAGEPSH